MLGFSVFSLLASFYAGREVEKRAGETGVRFTEEVLNAEQFEQLCEQAKEEQEDVPVMTLWKQTEGVEISGGDLERQAKIKVVDIWGDVEQVYPQRLSLGNTLIREDATGCMLSETAAYELFGGTDILGKEISCQGNIYRVRGILDLEEAVFLRENEKAGFTFIEVKAQPGSGIEGIRQMLLTAGARLEEGAVVETDTLRGLLRLLRLIPLGLLMWQVYRKGRECCKDREGMVWLMRIGMVVLFLAAFWHSWCFSEDFIPAKWSDFEFFSELLAEQRENYRRYLKLAEIYRDRMLLEDVKDTVVWILVSVVSALGILLKNSSVCPKENRLYLEQK